MRDVCILADETSKTYYAVSLTFVPTTEARGRPAVRAYTSKDLITWEGPYIIFQTPPDFWGGVNIRGIWAPELHAYKGKYYLFAERARLFELEDIGETLRIKAPFPSGGR